MVSLCDDHERIASLALLTLEVEGRGVELRLLATPEARRGRGYGRRLVSRLGESTAMRVATDDPRLEAFFTTFGFTHWYRRSQGGERLGFNALADIETLAQAPEVVDFSREAVLRAFKRDGTLFETYKRRFAEGLENFESLV